MIKSQTLLDASNDWFRDLVCVIGAHGNVEVSEDNLRRIVTAPKPEKPAQEA